MGYLSKENVVDRSANCYRRINYRLNKFIRHKIFHSLIHLSKTNSLFLTVIQLESLGRFCLWSTWRVFGAGYQFDTRLDSQTSW